MKKTVEFTDLLTMAADYNVADNPLFVSAAKQYMVQMKIIDSIEKILGEADLIVSKEYVKSRENVYSHPLVKELPKHADSANKTLGVMLDIITKLGQKTEVKSALSELMDE